MASPSSVLESVFIDNGSLHHPLRAMIDERITPSDSLGPDSPSNDSDRSSSLTLHSKNHGMRQGSSSSLSDGGVPFRSHSIEFSRGQTAASPLYDSSRMMDDDRRTGRATPTLATPSGASAHLHGSFSPSPLRGVAAAMPSPSAMDTVGFSSSPLGSSSLHHSVVTLSSPSQGTLLPVDVSSEEEVVGVTAEGELLFRSRRRPSASAHTVVANNSFTAHILTATQPLRPTPHRSHQLRPVHMQHTQQALSPAARSLFPVASEHHRVAQALTAEEVHMHQLALRNRDRENDVYGDFVEDELRQWYGVFAQRRRAEMLQRFTNTGVTVIRF